MGIKLDFLNIFTWKLSWDYSGMVLDQDIFNNHFGLGNSLNRSMLGPKTNFNFLKPIFFSSCQKLDFWVSVLKIYLVEYVRMDRTDHLGFSKN